MKTLWQGLLIASALLLTQAVTAPAAEAHGYRHGHPGYGYGYRHPYRYSYPYRYGYPYGYGSYPRYGYAPSLSLGYSSFGWSDSWGVGLSIPLYSGPRYERQTAVVYGPHTHDPDDRSYIPAPASAATRQTGPDCLQIREYQTEITVGDELLPAYGDACLQQDGSWKAISGPIVADY